MVACIIASWYCFEHRELTLSHAIFWKRITDMHRRVPCQLTKYHSGVEQR